MAAAATYGFQPEESSGAGFGHSSGFGHSTSSSMLPPISSPVGQQGGSMMSMTMRTSTSEPTLLADSFSRSMPGTFHGSFLKRQMQHPSIAARRSLAQKQKAMVKERRLDEDTVFWGAKGADGFRTYLKKKYGSIIAGWRVLDRDENGRLSFQEFCTACRGMGYHGDLKRLWRELDKNDNKFISIGEIDAEVGQMVGIFKLELLRKYGDMLTAWTEGIDLNKSGKVEAPEIEDCLRRLCLDMDAKKLTKMLIATPAGTGITLKDFDPEAHRRWLTSDTKGIFSHGDTEFLDDLGLNEEDIPEDARRRALQEGSRLVWRKQVRQAEVAETQAEVQKKYHGRLGLHTKEGFKKALIGRCGSLFAAWREALDLDGNDRLTFGEFTQALHRLGFHGDVQGLWADIDCNQNGVILFNDLDPETDEAWLTLRGHFCQEYGNMLRAWIKCLDVNGTNCVDEEQFVRACKEVKYGGDAKRLFKLMKPEAGRRFMSLKDFDIKAYKAFARNDFRMLSEPDFKASTQGSFDKDPLDMTLTERTEAGFFWQIRRAWNMSNRKEFAKTCRLYQPPPMRNDPLERFIHLCTRKYGSMVAAWRLGLDPEGVGRLNFTEFCVVARRVGYMGNVKQLWDEFCPKGRNVVTMKELDPEGDSAVTCFFEILHERYTELATFWSEILKKDPYASIKLTDLRDACRELGFPDDQVEKLFECLQPVPGHGEFLFLWDLEGMFVTTRKLWERKKPRNLRKQVMPAGTSLIVAKDQAAERAIAAKEEAAVDSPALQGSIVEHGLTLKLVQQAFVRDFVTTVNAWNTELDWRGVGAVTSGNFFPLIERVGLHGNVRKLWAELTGPRAVLRFVDLDPVACKMLGDIRGQLLDQFGTLALAWTKGFDKGGGGHLDLNDFLDVCAKILPDLKEKAAKTLFRSMLVRHGQRSVRMENMKALLVGLPTAKDRALAWNGGEAEEDAEPQAVRSKAEPKAIDKLEGFKSMLVHKYGSFFAAWKYCLDKDHNGLVAQKDFAEACRSLGATKSTAIWKEIDRANLGHVTLAMLDPETAECFAEFHDLLLEAAARIDEAQSPPASPAAEQQGEAVASSSPGSPSEAKVASAAASPAGPRKPNLKEAWQRVFDPKKIRRVDRTRFVAGCEVIGYSKDPVRLFELLRPEPCREYLVYTDIVDDLNPNSYDTKPGLRDTLLPMKKGGHGATEPNLRETLGRSQASQSPSATMMH